MPSEAYVIKNGTLTEFSLSNKILIILLGFFFSLLFRIDINTPILYYLVLSLSFFVYFSVFFLPKRKLMYPVFLIILVMPDLTQSTDELDTFGLIQSANLWQFSIGPLTPAVLIFFMLVVLLFRLLIYSSKFPYFLLVIYFILVPTLISIKLGFLQDSIARFASDFKIATFFCTGLFVFHCYFKRYKDDLWLLTQVFVYLAAGNFLIDVLKLCFNLDKNIDGQTYSNLSMDSAKGLITVFFFLTFFSIKKRQKYIFNFSIFALVIVMLFSYQTRWLLITLVLGFVLVLAFLGFVKFFKVFFVAFAISVVAIPLLNEFNPEPWRIMVLRFGFLQNLDRTADITDLELARGAAIINSFSTLYNNNLYFTGMGYGSWFTDSYFPMPNLTTSAFDEESLKKGQFYRVHDFVFHFLFKFGLLGILIYLSSFFKPLLSTWRDRIHFLKEKHSRIILLTYVGILPMVVTFMFTTGKGLLFSALFIVSFNAWIDYFKNQNDQLEFPHNGN